MTTRILSKVLALNLSALMSATLFSAVLLAMHSAHSSVLQIIELPTVVIIGHRSALTDTTARAEASQADSI